MRIPNGEAFASASTTWVRYERKVLAQGESVVIDAPFSVVTSETGAVSVDVMAGTYVVAAKLPAGGTSKFTVTVPDEEGPFNIADLIGVAPVTNDLLEQVSSLVAEVRVAIDGFGSVDAAITGAETARDLAHDWAIKSAEHEQAAEEARDAAELAAGVASRATSVAGLTDPATLADGAGGLVSGSGSSATDGLYEVQSSAWVRIMALDYASADQGKIAEAAAPGSVIQRTGTGQWIGFPDAAGFSSVLLGAGGAYGGALVPTGYSWGIFPDQVQMNGLAIRKGEDAVTRLALVDPAGFAKEFVSLDEIEALLAEMQAQIDALDGAEPAVVRGLDTGPTGLHLIREHMAVYRYSSTGIPKLALLGDSWFERNHIPDRLLYDIMQSRFGKGGSGFLSAAQTSYVLGGAALVLSGFTVHDISSERAAPSGPYGLSGDWIGTGGTAATATLTFWGSSLNIYYQDDDGTFRYSTDGGSTWTEVAGGGTGAAAKVTISGLGTAATNSIQIDTTTNAGTVRISGFYATGKAGLEISKCGNSDSRATDWSLFVGNDMCALILDDIQPHAGIVLLGTNDVLANVTPAQFQTGLEDIITACQTARAACGIALASSPRSEASGTYSMTDYRDVTFDLAEASAYVEAIDMVSHFGPYATSATVTGFWQDTRHLSHGGGRFWSELIYEAFFNLF